MSTLAEGMTTEALKVYWPASDVFTGSTVWISIKPMAVARLPFGPISSTVGRTARCGISVTVHCRVCESPAVTVESSTVANSGAGKSVGRERYGHHWSWQSWGEMLLGVKHMTCRAIEIIYPSQ